MLSWITYGRYGNDKAFIFGTFNVRYDLRNINCCTDDGGMSADVDIKLEDRLHAKSATRIPFLGWGIPPNDPFGTGRPFSTIMLEWYWSEKMYSQP